MTKHPTLEEFRAFARGELAMPVVRQVVAHLLTSCIDCKALAANVFRLQDAVAPAAPPPPTERPAGAVGRALAVARTKAALEIHTAPAGTSETAGGERGPHAGGLEELERLLDRAWSLRYDDPPQMIRVAELAVRAAFQLSAGEHGAGTVADWRARAYGSLGNAYRVADRIEEATGTLEIAEGLRRQGTGDETLLASLCNYRASLHSARREFDLALRLITRVFEIHSRRGESQLAGRALIGKAVFTAYSGNPEDALLLCDAGLASIDPDLDPTLYFGALHNKLSFLVECDRLDEACQYLERVKGSWASGSLNRLRLSWLEGRIHAGRGELASAREHLLAIRDELERRDLAYTAAIVALDLAVVDLKLLQFDRARQTIESALATFTKLRIPREALAATMLLHQAVEQGALCVALVERVSDRLRRTAS